jgi:hypothetical protein
VTADESMQAPEVLLGHCSLQVSYADRSLEEAIAEHCGVGSGPISRSQDGVGRWAMLFFGPLTVLLPLVIRLQEALPGQVETTLRIGVRLGSRPFLAHLTLVPDPS